MHVWINLGAGNEPLPGYINIDRRRCPGVQVIADITHLPFRSGSVTRVYASSVLEHFSDPYELLSEVHRVLHINGTAIFRVPSPWSFLAKMDPSHVFLADLKLWRQILRGYFHEVRVFPEGVRYRDNKLLTLIMHMLIRGLRFYEFAQCWRFECTRKRAQPHRAYIPWWLEDKYAAEQLPSDG